MASFHMDGDALVWFQDSDENGVFATWEGFVDALLTRFGSIAYEDPMESLTKLRQTSNVVVYKGQFEALSNRIKGLLESHKLSCFLSGLKDEVRLPMKMLHPKNLNEAFGLAKIQEEYLNSSHRGQRFSFDSAKLSILGPRLEGKMESRLKLPLQRLSPAQMEERRRKGLCFNCDEKFQPGHHCKSAKLFLLEGLHPFQDSSSNAQLVELDDSEATLLHLDEDKSIHSRVESKVGEAEITLYAFLGSPSPGTMRIQGKINGHCLVILIDTGSTYNFVDAAMISVLHLPLEPSVTFEVKVANGASIRTQGVCSNVKVAMQGRVFAVDLNALALGDCELVLGTQWLRTLGLIQWDFFDVYGVFSLQFQGGISWVAAHWFDHS